MKVQATDALALVVGPRIPASQFVQLFPSDSKNTGLAPKQELN